MKTLRFSRYGEPAEVLHLDEAQVPRPGAEQILVRVQACGDDMAAQVLEFCAGPPDLILDAGPISGILPELFKIAGGDGSRIVTVSNFGPEADELGVRNSFEGEMRYNVLGDFVKLAADGNFTVPVARTFLLEEWREALDLSLGGQARGKLVLLPASATARD